MHLDKSMKMKQWRLHDDLCTCNSVAKSWMKICSPQLKDLDLSSSATFESLTEV